jgi:predicted secreted protein
MIRWSLGHGRRLPSEVAKFGLAMQIMIAIVSPKFRKPSSVVSYIPCQNRRIVSAVPAASVAVAVLLSASGPVRHLPNHRVTSPVTAGSEIVIRVPNSPSATIDLNAVVPAGAVFSVVLYENPTTGFTWVRSPIGDSGPAVKYLDTSYVQDPAPPNMAGVGGTRTFRYQAGESGSTTIAMSYQRPWESVPLQRVTIDLAVA